MELLFWLSISLIAFAYFGYPITLKLLSDYFGKTFNKLNIYNENNPGFWPSVSIVIAAANEEKRILEKLNNTVLVAMEYGRVNKIIISLDGSTDNTNSLVTDYISGLDSSLTSVIEFVLLDNEKGGKEAAQKAALEHTTGDIIVFTDVATHLEDNTLAYLARHFIDPRIGAVDGMSKVRGENGGEGAYLKYENKIREWEAQLGGLVTLGGCLFAARHDLLQKDFSPVHQSDFRTALMCITHGYQAVLDRNAVALFDDTNDNGKEFKRKIRTVVRGMNNFFSHLYLLNPFKYGLFSYQLFCHKLLKWLVPFFMIIALVTNLAIIIDDCTWGYAILWIGQLMFYVTGFVGWLGNLQGGLIGSMFKIVTFFTLSNVGILRAWIEYAMGKRYVSWEATKR